MKKIWNIATWILGFGIILFMAAFSSKKTDELKVQGLDIQVQYDQQQYFVTQAEIEQIIRKEYPYLDSLFCKEININLLEERLDNHPSIRKAEVYSTLDGILRITVQQKKPVFRVHNSARDYYIDEKGDSMALSPNFSAEVPLVTGTVSAESRQKIFDFFQSLKNDSFFQSFFTGLQVEKNGEWTLYPKPGHHRVELGTPEELAKKLERLRIFYQSVIDSKNIDSIESLNLAYDKQVICTKY